MARRFLRNAAVYFGLADETEGRRRARLELRPVSSLRRLSSVALTAIIVSIGATLLYGSLARGVAFGVVLAVALDVFHRLQER
jgi:hypothetical protein